MKPETPNLNRNPTNSFVGGCQFDAITKKKYKKLEEDGEI